MSLFTIVGIYIVIWWTVLFSVLPLGMNQGAQDRPSDGGAWGAPVNPNLKRKVITTTWVAAIVWAVLMAVLLSGVVPLSALPGPPPAADMVG